MFNIDFTFLWTLFNLLLLFFILKKVLFGRIGAYMEKRAQKIADEYQRAGRERAEAKALLDSYNEKVQEAAAEGDALIKQARKAADAESARIIAGAKSEAARIIEDARRQIQNEQQAASVAFKAHTATLALAIAGRILRHKLNADDDRLLAERMLREIGDMGGR
ncbi:MAG: F0F1 ATP synthase subunit B [Spirochaetaceae bacterium]|jgi:F-type H+-transporting ATPase subunit b|nr:F0F1 ATP synthase subunit B [Spirochaetaceae bacterium]